MIVNLSFVCSTDTAIGT